MPETFHWLDVQRIAEELAGEHPGRNPYDVRFTELREMVRSLRGFQEQPGHPVNERILEMIQAAWADERDDADRDDD